MSKYQEAKQCALEYFQALERCSPEELPEVLAQHLNPHYEMRSVYPFREISGAAEAAKTV